MRTLPAMFLATTIACASDWASADIVDELRDRFQQKNPVVERIQLLDTKPRNSTYWVLARGIRGDLEFRGSLEDELFGLFVVDKDFTLVETVVDIMPTKRWNDYEMWIDSYTTETIVICGRGATYEDQKFRKSYRVPW